MEEVVFENVNDYLEMGIEMALTFAPKLMLALVTLIVGLWLINRFAAGVVAALQRSNMDETLQKFTKNLISIGLKVLLVISVASMVGIATTSFIAVIGAAGLAIGLALQGSLANFAGGMLILVFRPYKVGDFIETNGYMGTVEEIGIFNTTMTTPDNKTIIIPNGSISNNSIVNFSTQDTRRVDIEFGIGYDDDLKQAKDVLHGLIDSDERILSDPEPLIAISSLGDSAVNIVTRSWVKAEDYWPVYFDLTENAKLALEAAGITIPYPQRDTHVYQHTGT